MQPRPIQASSPNLPSVGTDTRDSQSDTNLKVPAWGGALGALYGEPELSKEETAKIYEKCDKAEALNRSKMRDEIDLQGDNQVDATPGAEKGTCKEFLSLLGQGLKRIWNSCWRR